MVSALKVAGAVVRGARMSGGEAVEHAAMKAGGSAEAVALLLLQVCVHMYVCVCVCVCVCV